MADPASMGVIAKAAISALSDERLRKGIGWTIAAILSPFILIIVILCGLLSGTASHNNNALYLSFNESIISGNIPEEYKGHIEDMRRSFLILDVKMEGVNSQIEDVDSLDQSELRLFFILCISAKIIHLG
ncbi:hypothetical protein ACR77J_11665 [Tissierella praeacuta]|uniref:hypothetical protein n=1 Tax=Tissierella praeacuta TaxID=43131 RepID=UPI003DA509B6